MDWFTLSLSCALSLAFADALTKKFFPTYDGWELLLVRFVVPALLMLPIAFSYPLPDVAGEFWLRIAVLIPLEILAMLLYLTAIRDSPLHVTLPYIAFTPVFNVVTGYILLGETLNVQGISGICLVVCGAYLLNTNHRKNGRSLVAPLLAIYRERRSRLMLATALIYNFTSAAGKVAMQYATPESFAPFYFIIIGACVFVITLLAHPKKLPVILTRPVHTLTDGRDGDNPFSGISISRSGLYDFCKTYQPGVWHTVRCVIIQRTPCRSACFRRIINGYRCRLNPDVTSL
jgi:drug/metabolite transporter (DMT)-like permease